MLIFFWLLGGEDVVVPAIGYGDKPTIAYIVTNKSTSYIERTKPTAFRRESKVYLTKEGVKPIMDYKGRKPKIL